MGKSITSNTNPAKSRASNSRSKLVPPSARIDLKTIWDSLGSSTDERLRAFGVIALGVVESVASGAISPDESIDMFFSFENCDFVQKKVRNRFANDVMGRGLQLDDALTIPPAPENLRIFRNEIDGIRSICRSLVEKQQPAAVK